jgi:soluble lytic murein transglycosylase-like protein
MSRKRVFSLMAAVALAAPVSADLAVFTDGQVAKIRAYEVHGQDIELFVPGGGSFTTSLLRIRRIVDDEIPPATEARDVARRGLERGDLSYRAGRQPLFGTPYDRLILRESREANLDPAFVSAVIKAESDYDAFAVSRKGARGLMQLMPSTARRMGVRAIFDPAQNIRAGVRYLRALADRFPGRPDLVLAAYNAGEESIESYGGVPPYRETVQYIRRIYRWWTPVALPPSV